ncbi:Uncharacterised protein [uncultured archaeon]|nr:Uncharacterised protein [uncultured archaeon]
MVADPRLVTFVQNNLAKNIPLEQIKKALISKGWAEAKINEAITVAVSSPQNGPVSKPIIQEQQRAGTTKNPKPKSSSNKVFIFSVIFIFALIVGVIVYLLFIATPKLSDEALSQGTSLNLTNGKEVDFDFLGQTHKVIIGSVSGSSVSLTIHSFPLNATLNIGETQKFDLDSNGFYDLSIKLLGITNQKANLYIKKINEQICVENWNCVAWSDCVNSTQARTCQDVNDCGTNLTKPIISKICTVPSCSEQNGTICSSNQTCSTTIVNASNGRCCLGNCTTPVTELAFISCGTDMTCFINASTNCNPSNLTYSFYSGNSTWNQSNSYYYKIRGIEDSKCALYQEAISLSGNFTSFEWTSLTTAGNTTDQINQMVETENNYLSDLIGTSGICKFSGYSYSDLTDYLNEVKLGNNTISGSALTTYSCTGSLFS